MKQPSSRCFSKILPEGMKKFPGNVAAVVADGFVFRIVEGGNGRPCRKYRNTADEKPGADRHRIPQLSKHFFQGLHVYALLFLLYFFYFCLRIKASSVSVDPRVVFDSDLRTADNLTARLSDHHIDGSLFDLPFHLCG